MTTFAHDMRYGLRLLWKQPGFAFVSVVTLALGIGATTALFSLVNTALLRPVYADRPAELVTVFNGDAGGSGTSNHAYPDYLDLRDGSPAVLSGLAAFTTRPANLIAGSETERINVGLVTDNYFRVLGVRPIAGRDFTADENVTPGAHAVAVISESLWRRDFGSRVDLSDQKVWLNTRPYSIVGVAPDGAARMAVVVKVDVFVPAMMQGAIRGGRDYLADRRSADFMVVGRLRSNISLGTAQNRIDRLIEELAQHQPEAWTRDGRIRPVTLLSEARSRGIFELRGYVVGFATLLMIGACGVLSMACANLSNVVIAQGLSRRSELAARVALGATRSRLVRQLLAETAIIAALGGAGGFIVAWWARGALRAFAPQLAIPLVIDLSLDYRVFAFSAIVTIAVTAAIGLVPAFQVTHPSLVSSVEKEARVGIGGRRISRVRNLLLAAQVAVSVLLVTAGAVMLRGLDNVQTTELGFTPGNVGLMSIDLSMQGYTPERGRVFVSEALSRLREVPGVTAVDLASTAPFGFSRQRIVVAADRSNARAGEGLPASVVRVGAEYFDAMDIPVLGGRAFTSADGPRSARVAVVNELVAQRLWPSDNPLGKRLFDESGQALEVVGVVRASKYESLFERARPQVYLPLGQYYGAALTVHARIATPPASALPALRRALLSVDSRLVIFDVRTMQEQIDVASLPLHLSARLFGLFGVVTLGLACIGLYGTLSFAVSQRIAEIGVRMALGARPADVMRLVMHQGVRPLIQGTLLGLAPCVVAVLVLENELAIPGLLAPRDALVLPFAVVLQVVLAGLACWVPARRATRLDPVAALRRA